MNKKLLLCLFLLPTISLYAASGGQETATTDSDSECEFYFDDLDPEPTIVWNGKVRLAKDIMKEISFDNLDLTPRIEDNDTTHGVERYVVFFMKKIENYIYGNELGGKSYDEFVKTGYKSPEHRRIYRKFSESFAACKERLDQAAIQRGKEEYQSLRISKEKDTKVEEFAKELKRTAYSKAVKDTNDRFKFLSEKQKRDGKKLISGLYLGKI